jgi:hypothetical protein
MQALVGTTIMYLSLPRSSRQVSRYFLGESSVSPSFPFFYLVCVPFRMTLAFAWNRCPRRVCHHRHSLSPFILSLFPFSWTTLQSRSLNISYIICRNLTINHGWIEIYRQLRMRGLWLVTEVEESLGQVVERMRTPVRTAAAPVWP